MSDERFIRFVPLASKQAAVRQANQPQQRAKRPGQLPPFNRGRPRQRSAAEEGAIHDDDLYEGVDIAAEEGERTGAWAARVQQRNASFQNHRPRNTQRLQQYAALQQAGDQLRLVSSIQEIVADRVKQAYMRHGCQILEQELAAGRAAQQQQQPADGQELPVPADVLRVVSSRQVACHVLGSSFWLKVPTVTCGCCNSSWEVHPADVGFFSNSPEQPFVWFDCQMLQLYTHLFYPSGTCMSCFADAMSKTTAISSQSAADGTAVIPGLLPIAPRQLEVAWQEWSRAAAYALSPHTLAVDALSTLGPTRFCPPCAGTPGSAGAATVCSINTVPQHSADKLFRSQGALNPDLVASAAPTALSVDDISTAGLLPGRRDDFLPVWDIKHRVSAVAFDANVKANRYRSAGRSGGWDNVGRVHHRFLDAAHDHLSSLHAAGDLPVTRRGSTAVADDLDLELEGQCHPRLSCARETSLTSGISDECGLAGCTCSHGVPILGGFLAMPAPERFLYYDLINDHLLPLLDIDVMYLDTGCVYKVHFAASNAPDAPAPKHIRVPWWHCRGHGAHCAPYNSGLYLTGAGRRVGENCEHLWAELKPLTQITRFMAKPNYLDSIDAGLSYIAESKLEEFVATMVTQEKHARAKLEDCSARTRRLLAMATASGISHAQLAAATLQLSKKISTVAEDLAPEEKRDKLLVDYVRVHKQLQCLQQLRQGAAALSVALPGSEGRNLHSHSQNQKRVDKLFDRLGSLATKLDLAAPLQPSSSDYIRGLSLLRDEEISTLQKEIEKLVAGLQVLKFDRQQAGAASRLTRSQRKMATSKRKRVQQLLSVMLTWQQLQLPSSSFTTPLPSNWSEADISQLFKGIYPWQQGSNAVLGAVTKIMAERFRDACAEEARCIEEVQLLRFERQRTLQYYTHIINICSQEAGLRLDQAESRMEQAQSSVTQNSSSSGNCSTVGVVNVLEEYSQLLAEALLLQRSVEEHNKWLVQASVAFGKL